MPLTYDEADALSRRFLDAGYSNVTADMVLKDPTMFSEGHAQQAEVRARSHQAQSDAMETRFDELKELIAQL